MSAKTTALIAATTLVLGLSALEHLTPRTAADLERTRQQQQLEDLADAHEIETDRQRRAGQDHLDAELDTRNTPSHRTPPPPPRPRPRIR